MCSVWLETGLGDQGLNRYRCMAFFVECFWVLWLVCCCYEWLGLGWAGLVNVFLFHGYMFGFVWYVLRQLRAGLVLLDPFVSCLWSNAASVVGSKTDDEPASEHPPDLI